MAETSAMPRYRQPCFCLLVSPPRSHPLHLDLNKDLNTANARGSCGKCSFVLVGGGKVEPQRVDVPRLERKKGLNGGKHAGNFVDGGCAAGTGKDSVASSLVVFEFEKRTTNRDRSNT